MNAKSSEIAQGPSLVSEPLETPRRRRFNARRLGLHNYVLITPAYAVFVFVLIVPIGAAIWFSMFHFDFGGRTWVGTDNYRAVLGDDATWHALQVTVIFTLMAVIGGMAIALAVALLLYPLPTRVRNFFRSTLYLPAIIPIAATALIWKWLFNYSFGFLNYLLGTIGLGPYDWLGSLHLALPSVTGMVLATGLGATILILLAAIDAVPRDYLEAAQIDGAGTWTIFRRILLPLIKPALLYLVVVQTISAFQVFAPFVLMTKGGPINRTTTLGYQVYTTAFESFDFGRASALAVVMLVVISAIAVIEFRLLRSNVQY